ncbi:hypothetical protein [Faecalicoccus pleomorphus]|uniref:hypothetical protein n=1 Tax=Faecalicoccus pleomorphus TaxID=1323 RepID=UPI0026EBFA0F|nr:hypothetical protein [Faecalicoccus pleomorphus]
MKVSAEEFKELEKWILVRDYSLRARQLLQNAIDLANLPNQDKNKVAAEELLIELLTISTDKIGQFVD